MRTTKEQKELIAKYKDDFLFLEKLQRLIEQQEAEKNKLKSNPEYREKTKLQAQDDIKKYNNNFATVLVNLKEYMDTHPNILNLDLRIMIGGKTQFLVQINDINYIPFGKKNSLSFKSVTSAMNKVQRDLKDVDVLLQFIEPDLMEKMTKIGENEFINPEEVSKILSKEIDDTPFYEYANIPNDDITLQYINTENIHTFINERILPEEIFILYEQKIIAKEVGISHKNGTTLKV